MFSRSILLLIYIPTNLPSSSDLKNPEVLWKGGSPRPLEMDLPLRSNELTINALEWPFQVWHEVPLTRMNVDQVSGCWRHTIAWQCTDCRSRTRHPWNIRCWSHRWCIVPRRMRPYDATVMTIIDPWRQLALKDSCRQKSRPSANLQKIKWTKMCDHQWGIHSRHSAMHLFGQKNQLYGHMVCRGSIMVTTSDFQSGRLGSSPGRDHYSMRFDRGTGLSELLSSVISSYLLGESPESQIPPPEKHPKYKKALKIASNLPPRYVFPQNLGSLELTLAFILGVVHQGYDWVCIDWISYHPECVRNSALITASYK